MFGTLNGIELPAPSTFSEEREVIGGYNVTLTGTKRRYIKAIKKKWNLTYDILSVSTYNSIISVYDSLIPNGIQTSTQYAVFSLTDTRFGVSFEDVHMDISDRNFIPGTDLLSSVNITLMQI